MAKPSIVGMVKEGPRGLGRLVVVDMDKCDYFPDRPVRVAGGNAGMLSPLELEEAMDLGMWRVGPLLTRPLCVGCRRCVPFRVDTERFVPSRSQQRVRARCETKFIPKLRRPTVDAARLRLLERHHRSRLRAKTALADANYEKFFAMSCSETWEVTWYDDKGVLVAVGILDELETGICSTSFFWEPLLDRVSLGVWAALWEIDLCRERGKRYYHLGYLVKGARNIGYKAQFAGGEVWNGTEWVPLPTRSATDPETEAALDAAEEGLMRADAANFPIVEEPL